MNADWTVWFRPNGSRTWSEVGRAPDRGAAWALMLGDSRSGGWYACEPGRLPPGRPRAERPPRPASRQGAIRWD